MNPQPLIAQVVDVSNVPEIRALADDVEQNGIVRILRVGSRYPALLVPSRFDQSRYVYFGSITFGVPESEPGYQRQPIAELTIRIYSTRPGWSTIVYSVARAGDFADLPEPALDDPGVDNSTLRRLVDAVMTEVGQLLE